MTASILFFSKFKEDIENDMAAHTNVLIFFTDSSQAWFNHSFACLTDPDMEQNKLSQTFC